MVEKFYEFFINEQEVQLKNSSYNYLFSTILQVRIYLQLLLT